MCSSVVHLPPLVNEKGGHSSLFLTIVAVAREKGVSAYIADVFNRRVAVDRVDTAHPYRLAMDKGTAGGTYHG